MRHRTTLAFTKGHDIELAKEETVDQWRKEVAHKDHEETRMPYIRVIHTTQNPVSKNADKGLFRVTVIGEIVPLQEEEPDDG